MGSRSTSSARARARSIVVLLAGLLLVSSAPSVASGEEANLTQFGAKEYQRTAGSPNSTTDTFNAAAAPGRLIITGQGGAKVRVTLNGARIVDIKKLDGRAASIRVDLQATNSLKVQLRGKPGSSVSVKVKQRVYVDTSVTGVGIYGIQVTDFERELDFWEKLGLRGVINPAGPETNTIEMARVLGLDAPYRLKVALHWVVSPGVGGGADTVEFIDPLRTDPPYTELNHLGYTHATYGTGDIDAAVSYLRSEGVTVVSDPAGNPGSRFVFVKDADGTFLKLVEDAGAPAQPVPTAVTRMTSISLNASDLDATREYLKLFGFTRATPVRDVAPPFSPKAYAWGFPGGYRNTGFDLSNPEDPSAPKIELRRWQNPYDAVPAYPLPVTHLGIHRMILNATITNLTAVTDALKGVGVQEVGPPARCCSGNDSPTGIVLFTGPDNMVVELTGPIPR